MGTASDGLLLGQLGAQWLSKSAQAPTEKQHGNDFNGVVLVLSIAGPCTLVAAGVLCAGMVVHRWCPPANKVQFGKLSVWRSVVVVLIGLSPLLWCVFGGEGFKNVLIAMVVMHWACMMTLPVMYYVSWSFTAKDVGQYAVSFYSELFIEQRQDLLQKMLRGSIIGIMFLVCAVGGFLLLRCETYSWRFCMKKFEKPLKEYGFAPYSEDFRWAAALYFTFINPVFEELFWRVFLHRELPLALGADLPVSGVEASLLGRLCQGGDSGNIGPWSSLLHEARAISPRRVEDLKALEVASLCRWGVSVMYASYHMWPMKVVFRSIWWVYVLPCFLGLVFLGRGFLLMRESAGFGLPAATVMHVFVDAAFSIICLVHFPSAE